MLASGTHTAFVVVFQHYVCIYGYQIVSDQEKLAQGLHSHILLQLLTITTTSETGIAEFECGLFDNQRLVLVGTNKQKTSINIA